MLKGRSRICAAAILVLAAAVSVHAQFGGGRFRRFFERGVDLPPNTPYDGRFTFVRMRYKHLPGGSWYQGLPAWVHGYPVADGNLMKIMNEVSYLDPHIEEVNVLDWDDPEIFKYPVLYVIEVGWWDMTDAEAQALRTYIRKGGFVIVDDFKVPGGIGGGGWEVFAHNMKRVFPNVRYFEMDPSHLIFHSFFEIHTLDNFPQAYNAGRAVFRGVY
jgi:hypothetical protein